MANTVYFSELQAKMLELIDTNITGYKNLRNIENDALNTDGNDDEKALTNIQEYTTDVTKLQTFRTKISSLFTKAYGESYSANTLLSELVKLCSEKYDDASTTLTNFYSDILLVCISSFIQKDNTEVTSA